MIGRLLINVGIFAVGYYIGKQMGLSEQIRKDLAAKRTQRKLSGDIKHIQTGQDSVPSREKQPRG